MSDLLERRFALACSPGHAFKVFTTMTDLWWPRNHRRTREAALVMEPQLGGRLMERSPDGTEWLIGKVTRFEPPQHLSFDWYPGSPAAPTAVDIEFAGSPGVTQVHILHRPLSAGAIEAWPGKVALFQRGWDTIMPALAAWIADNTGD